jgi:formylglycine-generating enzyme required for sulfatase activity
LPTEAEREKASRSGREGAAYPWGDTLEGGGVFSAETVLPASLTHADTRDGVFPQAAPFDVGLSRPNLYGLLDIAYNIHEWCSDWYDPTYYAESPTHDPRGPMSGKRRASRGGAWRHQLKICRNGARSSLVPEFRYNDYGFRLARDP